MLVEIVVEVQFPAPAKRVVVDIELLDSRLGSKALVVLLAGVTVAHGALLFHAAPVPVTRIPAARILKARNG
jgi:hypothetical protein